MWDVDVGCGMWDVGCWMLDVGCWMLDVGCFAAWRVGKLLVEDLDARGPSLASIFG